MSSSPSEPSDIKNDAPKEKDYRTPGFRGVKTTSLFRAVNPELFIKPNKPVMAFGLFTITMCVAYIAYLHATEENKKDLYEAIDSEGNRYTRRKTSRWDWTVNAFFSDYWTKLKWLPQNKRNITEELLKEKESVVLTIFILHWWTLSVRRQRY